MKSSLKFHTGTTAGRQVAKLAVGHLAVMSRQSNEAGSGDLIRQVTGHAAQRCSNIKVAALTSRTAGAR